ncbi:MAG: DUF2442 domain-containing protein [Treponema sp.]|nr:DUF2442 domain-containing protein [Treponema sp.]
MSFSKENARAKRVWFDDLNMWILFEDGRQLSIPKFYFESLKNASIEKLNNYELLGGGLGIHWEELDEDLYVPNLLISVSSQEIA